MVESAYLLIGQDSCFKNNKIKEIKEKFLKRETLDFNLDILYAHELDLLTLQEKLLQLPVNSSKRIIIVKEAEKLKEEIKKFLLDYFKKPYPQTIIIFDIEKDNPEDKFINLLKIYARVLPFKEERPLNIFDLKKYIEAKKINLSLKTLHQLLLQGERPEQILGNLRVQVEGESSNSLEKRRKIKAILDCDIEIKTSRLKPVFALEKLLIRLIR